MQDSTINQQHQAYEYSVGHRLRCCLKFYLRLFGNCSLVSVDDFLLIFFHSLSLFFEEMFLKGKIRSISVVGESNESIFIL